MNPADTRENGIRFEVPYKGSGTPDDPYRPAIFDAHPDSYFHFDATGSDDPGEAGARAVVWINKDRSPAADVDAIRSEKAPLGTVLEET